MNIYILEGSINCHENEKNKKQKKKPIQFMRFTFMVGSQVGKSHKLL